MVARRPIRDDDEGQPTFEIDTNRKDWWPSYFELWDCDDTGSALDSRPIRDEQHFDYTPNPERRGRDGRAILWLLLCALATIVAVVVVFTTPAYGQTMCAPRDHVLIRLDAMYGETVRMRGLSGGNLVEMFAGAEGGWTIIATDPNGVTCIIAAGTDFVSIPAGEPM